MTLPTFSLPYENPTNQNAYIDLSIQEHYVPFATSTPSTFRPPISVYSYSYEQVCAINTLLNAVRTVPSDTCVWYTEFTDDMQRFLEHNGNQTQHFFWLYPFLTELQLIVDATFARAYSDEPVIITKLRSPISTCIHLLHLQIPAFYTPHTFPDDIMTAQTRILISLADLIYVLHSLVTVSSLHR